MKCLISFSSKILTTVASTALMSMTRVAAISTMIFVSTSAIAASDDFFVLSEDAANLTAAAAPAISVVPTKDQAICLKREYSEDHLREYPKQKLSSMYILLRRQKLSAEDAKSVDVVLTEAQVIGQKSIGDKEYYANWDALCEKGAKGSARCMVECDGGSFNLIPRPTDVLFSVDKDFSFPLYRPGMTRDTATDADTISLDGKDRHNSIYRLNQAPVRECIDARKHAKQISSDC